MRSMPHPQLYSSLHSFVLQTLPDECDTRSANLLLIKKKIFLTCSVRLEQIARKLPSRAKRVSSEKRVRRFVANPMVHAREWFDPFARWTRICASSIEHLHLTIDTTKVAFGFRLVMVSVTYRRHSLPIAGM